MVIVQILCIVCPTSFLHPSWLNTDTFLPFHNSLECPSWSIKTEFCLCRQREWTEDDWSILNIIDTVLTGQATGEEQMAVQLDRALATSGWSPSCISAMKAPRIANYVGVNELMQPGCTCAFVPTVIPYLSEYRLWVLTTTASTASLHNGKTQMRREVSSSVWIQEHQEGQLLLTGQLPLNLFQFRSWS